MLRRPIAFQIKAFSLIESLLVLSVTVFIVMSFSISFNNVMTQVEERLFFLSFEHLYRDTQTLSALRKEPMMLNISREGISNGEINLSVPKSIDVDKSQQLIFDHGGGNSSLKKVVFENQTKRIQYQLHLGSGKYQKTERQRVYPVGEPAGS